MGLFDFIFKRNSKQEKPRAYAGGGLPFARLSDHGAMNLSAFYACVDAISSDVAKLPLEPYTIDERGRKVKALDDPTYELLCFTPDESGTATRFTFLQALVTSMLLKGDGFASIERDPRNGYARSMHFERYEDVTVYYKTADEGGGISHYYNNRTGRNYAPEDMIHILGFSYDGLRGVSCIRHAASVLGISTASDERARKALGDGVATGILTFQQQRIKGEKRQDIIDEWNNTVSYGNNGLAIIDGGATYTPLNVNPRDAQLLESRQFNVVEICRFFRISPVKIGDLSKSSYSTVEATNSAYLADTLSTHLVKIELELRRKLYPRQVRGRMRVEFDTSEILRIDTMARTQMMSQLAPYAVMTTNEMRQMLNLEPISGGDEPFVMTNMQRLSNIDNLNPNTNNQHDDSTTD